MKISARGRYALAAIIEIARNGGRGENISVLNIAGNLGISKIYLEQVFTQLKKADLLLATKGARGGYQLTRPPSQITVWEVLSILESTLAEPTESTVAENAPEIEQAIVQLVFEPLDRSVQHFLSQITVQHLLDESEKNQASQSFMLNL